MSWRDQTLSLLAAANNHGDLAVKLSSLKQVKDIFSSVEPSLASDLYPYLLDLQSSPENLLRRLLIELIQDIGLRAMEHSSPFMPMVLAFLRDNDTAVAKQAIVCGSHFFCSVFEEMSLQFQRRGKMEQWTEELWMWMLRFKDAVFSIALDPGYVGSKLLAFKFLETYVLLFTSEGDGTGKYEGSRQPFNFLWLLGCHPALDPVVLTSEAKRTLAILLDLLQSFNQLPGTLAISVVNCLAAIGRKRPLLYPTVLSALLDFNPNHETLKGHAASLLFSFRTAFLGFLRCTHPAIVESRDRLLRALRTMNAGDAGDHVIRQVDKMLRNNGRALRETRDDLSSNLVPDSGDLSKKRVFPQDFDDSLNSLEVASKRMRHDPNSQLPISTRSNDFDRESVPINGVSHKVPRLDGELSPAEQMISMIAALLAEGERGAESLEILISNIHPDLLADIVITNMKHLPKTPPATTSSVPTNSIPSPKFLAHVPPPSVVPVTSSFSEMSAANNLPVDSKRDPRRDPRRLDPRRAAISGGLQFAPSIEDTSIIHPDFDTTLSKPPSQPAFTALEKPPTPVMCNSARNDDKILESPSTTETNQAKHELSPRHEVFPNSDDNAFPDHTLPGHNTVKDSSEATTLMDYEVKRETATLYCLESDEDTPAVSSSTLSEETCQELPLLPSYIELTEEQQRKVKRLAVEQIIESFELLQGTEYIQTRMALLARLVAQIDADNDMVEMLQQHVIGVYCQQKGHELVMNILYHLHSHMCGEESSYAAVVYEQFLLAVAKSLLENFPPLDKSFSKVLSDAPLLPESALNLLEDLCYADVVDAHGKEFRDGERVTQGLGAVWSLILGRPNKRQACLDIALKCSVHSQDGIRGKAIRLVANKLYQLSYITENIEQFARNALLSVVDQHVSDLSLCEPTKQNSSGEEASTSGPHVSESGISENDSTRAQLVGKHVSSISFPEAQQRTSLFFALCTKKPSLLQLIFDSYGRAPKPVKQAFHRHIPIVVKALGSSSDLLHTISDPPQGCDDLLSLVVQILVQETTPSSELMTTVKHLYETKLKDATILIPMLSSFSKKEVIPIFPRLVDLPLEKFQVALAHILQGSAHSGPALTPAEVLVAIHDIVPEKNGLGLKKITEACSACFEQRQVFTQQVLARALNQMVDQVPLPLLFMRTVIQAIDAFPTLVDFVMEILSKLVSKQVWRMPKLWVGFLKCVYQTQPHSFQVLLKLPAPQLENALNKYNNLRGPLTAYASQSSTKTSLARPTLSVLGLSNEVHIQQQ
ncbi:uncharacterized protein [Rutidosis leptorrhynchoides]|uniref:uncharacterized protein n=1 Tax=Rutidosis leptorrhynchoides TaxID=125765 RepID=UPI003A999C69